LIPNTTAGLLIGKNGCFIKQIKEESGAFVQISPKQNDLPERIVCIEGDVDKRNIAFNLVVKKISEDPQHNSVPNLNYSVNSNDGNVSKNNSSSGGQAHNKFDFNSAANYLGKSLFIFLSRCIKLSNNFELY
jgi:RNA-binding protein Nova